MIRNLRTVNLITRGLPTNLIGCLPTLKCAYTIWKFLEERFPDYSLKNLDEILHKSIALSKMNSSDPSFGDYLFELTKEVVQWLWEHFLPNAFMKENKCTPFTIPLCMSDLVICNICTRYQKTHKPTKCKNSS